jgi:hypothetical protein
MDDSLDQHHWLALQVTPGLMEPSRDTFTSRSATELIIFIGAEQSKHSRAHTRSIHRTAAHLRRFTFARPLNTTGKNNSVALDHVTDTRSKHIHSERFGNDLHIFFQKSTGGRFLGIAGHEQNLQIFPHGSRRISDTMTTDIR